MLAGLFEKIKYYFIRVIYLLISPVYSFRQVHFSFFVAYLQCSKFKNTIQFNPGPNFQHFVKNFISKTDYYEFKKDECFLIIITFLIAVIDIKIHVKFLLYDRTFI